MKSKIRLGVNIDHIATLRQVRGGTTSYPDLLWAAQEVARAGGDQITIHLREDRRHIQLQDLEVLAKKRPLPLNLEMAANPEMLRYAKKHRPDWCCFVPEKRQELTTEGGLDVVRTKKSLAPMIEKLQRIGIEISMFIEPSQAQVVASYEIGADAVELHTGKWVRLAGPAKEREMQRLIDAAQWAHGLGLNVHAGHGLDSEHTRIIVQRLPHLEELNIGHSIVCDSIRGGLKMAVQKIRKAMRAN